MVVNETKACTMHNRIDIDYVHSRAIVREIGERLRSSLKPEPALPPSLKMQIDRLRELEEQLPSIVPDAEHWKYPPLSRRWVGRIGTSNAIAETPCVKDFERVR